MTACYQARCDRSHCRKTATDVTHPGLTLATSILASSLAFIDSSVTNVALPALRQSLGGTSVDLQWTINAYALPLAALLLVGGAVGDKFGRRRLLVLGMALFALASIGCAAAPSYAVLVPMRALQGVGAAMLMPNSLALLSAAFPEKTRGRAIGTWAAVGVVASAAGPVIGGWLIGLYGWRAIFLINVPLAAVAIFLALRYVTEWRGREMPVDWLGGGLATVALGLLAWTLTLWSSRRTMPAAAPAELAVALAVLVAFFLVELRLGERAMLPLGMFASRAFLGLTSVTFLIYAALSGLFLLLPYVLIEGGYTPLQAGLALLPFPFIVALGSRPLGQLASRYGARWPLAAGSLVSSAGYALMTWVDPAGSYLWTIVPGNALMAIGMAGAVAPLQTAVLGAVDEQHTGTASGLNSAVSRGGGLIATALSGAVLAQKGDALVASFHAACWVGAAMTVVSALVAAWALGPAAAPPATASSAHGRTPEPRMT